MIGGRLACTVAGGRSHRRRRRRSRLQVPFAVAGLSNGQGCAVQTLCNFNIPENDGKKLGAVQQGAPRANCGHQTANCRQRWPPAVPAKARRTSARPTLKSQTGQSETPLPFVDSGPRSHCKHTQRSLSPAQPGLAHCLQGLSAAARDKTAAAPSLAAASMCCGARHYNVLQACCCCAIRGGAAALQQAHVTTACRKIGTVPKQGGSSGTAVQLPPGLAVV